MKMSFARVSPRSVVRPFPLFGRTIQERGLSRERRLEETSQQEGFFPNFLFYSGERRMKINLSLSSRQSSFIRKSEDSARV